MAAMASTSGNLETKSTPKPSKPGKNVIIIRLPSSLLEKFPTDKVRKETAPQPSSDTPSDPPAPAPGSSSGQDGYEQDATPTPDVKIENGALAPLINGPKRKFGPRGIKRGIPGPDGVIKPRGKPGPKKKPRPDEDPNDESNKSPWTGPNLLTTQKLGPKANQGAINAGLRALDRTGKKCRRWERKGYELKSFTGVAWLMPQWSTPKLLEQPNADRQSEATNSQDGKVEDSAAGSASSNTENEVNGHAGPEVPSSPAAPTLVAVNG